MKRKASLLCLLLIAALLASCGGGYPGIEPDGGGSDGEDTELTLWTYPVGNWGNPTAVSNILTSFYREYPDIHISVEYLNYDNGDEKLTQAVQEGKGPDLVLEGPERLIAEWGDMGWMVDLSDLWESSQAGAIYENIRQACRHSSGAYYAFPICMSAHCMAINYDMFQAAGALPYIDEERHTWTTDGFIKAVQALKDYGLENVGVLYCKNQSGDQGTRALVNNLYGGDFTDEAHTRYTADSEENRKALQLLCDLDGIAFAPDLSSSEAIAQFIRKETAMCFCWNVSLEIQQTINDPNLNFEVFPIAFPTNGTDPELQGGIWGFGVLDSGSQERIEAAKTFIRYVTENDAAYTRAVLTSSYWPVREMANLYENDRLMTEYSIFMPYVGDYYQITPGWAEARAAWRQVLERISGGTGVADAVRGFPSLEDAEAAPEEDAE